MLDGIAAEDLAILKGLNLLTSKPVLYVCNVAEAEAATGNEQSAGRREDGRRTGRAHRRHFRCDRIGDLPARRRRGRANIIEAMGLEEPGLDRLIREGYRLLDLITFFTAGPKETRAWTVRKGSKAPQAAGEIHTDFEKGFIRAQTISYDDYVTLGGETAAREAGKARDEGKEYVVQDGDVMLFKFNV